MPTYIGLLKWTDQGMKDMRHALIRQDQARAFMEKAGGRVIGVWWTQGPYDAVIVSEFPDDETASMVALATGLAGNARTETVRAYTREEMQRILQRLP